MSMSDMFNIFCGIVTIISLILTIYFGVKSNEFKAKLKKMEWSDVLSSTDLLWSKLKKDRFIPDVILVPGLRGCCIAEILINKMGHHIPVFVGSSIISQENINRCIDNFTPINVSSNWNIFIPDVILKYKDSKILIIDDFTLAGKFPQDLKDYLIANGLHKEKIRTFYAVITSVTKARCATPDYYWKIIDDDDFYFPWGRANLG